MLDEDQIVDVKQWFFFKCDETNLRSQQIQADACQKKLGLIKDALIRFHHIMREEEIL